MIHASLGILAADFSRLAFQDAPIPQTGGDGRLMVIFMGIAAISLLVLALLAVGTLVALIVVGIKAKRTLLGTVNEVKGRAYPLIEKSTGLIADLAPVIRSVAGKADALISDLTPTIKGIAEKTHNLVEEISPKVSAITDDLHRISSNASEMAEFSKMKLQEFSPAITAAKDTFMKANSTVRSANEMTERQVARVDEMVTDVLNWTTELPVKLEYGLGAPGRMFAKASKRVAAQGMALTGRVRDLWNGIKASLGGDRGSPSYATRPSLPMQGQPTVELDS